MMQPRAPVLLCPLTLLLRTACPLVSCVLLAPCSQNIMIVDRRLVLTDFGNAQRFLLSDPPALRRVRFGIERRPREFAPLEQVSPPLLLLSPLLLLPFLPLFHCRPLWC